MISYCDQRDPEMDLKIEILRKLKNDCVLLKEEYIRKNEINEETLLRLLTEKDELTFFKDILIKDLNKLLINAGKRKMLFRFRVKEFQDKNHTVKLQMENLPSKSQLQELIKSNQQLITEYLTWKEKLKSVREEYQHIQAVLESDFKMKVITFSKWKN